MKVGGGSGVRARSDDDVSGCVAMTVLLCCGGARDESMVPEIFL